MRRASVHSEKRYNRKRNRYHYERYQRRMREERPEPTPTQDGKTGVGASTDRVTTNLRGHRMNKSMLRRPKDKTERDYE